MYVNNLHDDAYIKKATKILYRCANRDVAPQFFNKFPGKDEQYYIGRKEDSNQDFLAIVLDYDASNKQLIVEQRNYFKVGDKVNIFTYDGNEYSLLIEHITDMDGNSIKYAPHPKEIVKIDCDKFIPKNSIMRVNFLDWQKAIFVVILYANFK